MTDHDNEKWVALYQTALLELERAATTGRIGDARTEIALRLEALKGHPGLYKAEYQAIQDALSNLRSLERQEASMVAEDQKRILQEAAERLKSVAHKFQGQGQSDASDQG